MFDKERIPKELLDLFESNIKGRAEVPYFPCPAFEAMQGEFINYDFEEKLLTIKFPVLKEQLNPYGTMQGGMIAAAIDNTIGPLSLLVSTPNFTRHMETKYVKVIPFDLEFIYVKAFFIEKKKRQLFFEAIVEDQDGNKLATAKSTNWVID